MSRRRLPERGDGVVLSTHRRPNGSITFERRLHLRRDGGAYLIDWIHGERLPSEWISLSREELAAISAAVQGLIHAAPARDRALRLLNRWLSQHRDGGATDPCGVAPELVAETRDAVRK